MVKFTETTSCRGEVSVRIHDARTLSNYHSSWHELPDKEKIRVAEHVQPLYEGTTENTTCTGLHEWLSEALHGGQNPPPDADMVAVGRSDATPQETDTSLNDFVEQIDVAEYAVEGQQIRISVFVAETEANVDISGGETLSEIGIYADDRLLNHALLPRNFEKDNTKTMTVEIVLSFASASN